MEYLRLPHFQSGKSRLRSADKLPEAPTLCQRDAVTGVAFFCPQSRNCCYQSTSPTAVERLQDVLQDVIPVLQARADADQSGRDIHRPSFVFRMFRMRGAGGVVTNMTKRSGNAG